MLEEGEEGDVGGNAVDGEVMDAAREAKEKTHPLTPPVREGGSWRTIIFLQAGGLPSLTGGAGGGSEMHP